MPDVPAAYLEDASGIRGHADRLFIPDSDVELARILQTTSGPVTLAGAGTGVTGGRVPMGGTLVSLERFRRLEISPGRAVAGAGVLLKDLHAAAAQSGQLYPPDPTEWSASVGGTIATNASGSRSYLYGSTRRWVRSVKAVFGDGSIQTFTRGDLVDFPFQPVPPSRARKSTAGYYLQEPLEWVDLLCGSEGTLAAVVEAELELLPQPGTLLSGIVFFPSTARALNAVDAWRAVPQLRMLEYMDESSLFLLRASYPDIPSNAAAALLIEQISDNLESDPIDDWIARLEESGALTEDSWFGEEAADRERFRRLRHTLPELVNERVRRNGFQKLGSDFAVPVEANGEMMDFYIRVLDEEMSGKYVIFGHIGDAHLHVNLLPESENDARRGAELMVRFARKAVELGGTVSAEHGLGRKKAHLLPIQFSEGQIDAMKAVKRRLDPQWRLAPGVLFPSEGGV